jgi:hypothetical protein
LPTAHVLELLQEFDCKHLLGPDIVTGRKSAAIVDIGDVMAAREIGVYQHRQNLVCEDCKSGSESEDGDSEYYSALHRDYDVGYHAEDHYGAVSSVDDFRKRKAKVE